METARPPKHKRHGPSRGAELEEELICFSWTGQMGFLHPHRVSQAQATSLSIGK